MTGASLDRKTYKGISGGFGTYAQRDPARHMVRLRLPGGRLPSAQLKFIADSIERYQVEKIKLTTCETVQLHDLTAGQVPQLIREAAGAGIVCRGRRRRQSEKCDVQPAFRRSAGRVL